MNVTEQVGPGEAKAKAVAESLKPKGPDAPIIVGKFAIRTAQRSNSKLRIGLAGPSGSGKTYSALLMAHGMAPWEKIFIVDTENGSADLYSHIGPYKVLTLEKPFSPERYVEAIEACQENGAEVIIIDSITHEWSGDGGALAIQDQLGGRFQDWAKVTPMHNRFIQAMLRSSAHIITTVRTKTDYSMTTDGKSSKVQKVGTKPETREGFEYEMTISFDLNINNLAACEKDRTGLFKGKAAVVITEETGKTLSDWASHGVDYVGMIEKLLEKKGKTQQPILAAYKVYSIDELTTAQLKGVMQRLEGMPDAVKEEKKSVAAKPAEGSTV